MDEQMSDDIILMIWVMMYLENLNGKELDEGLYIEYGAEELQMKQAKVIEGNEELEWNEEFEFNDESGDGVYDRFVFLKRE